MQKVLCGTKSHAYHLMLTPESDTSLRLCCTLLVILGDHFIHNHIYVIIHAPVAT